MDYIIVTENDNMYIQHLIERLHKVFSLKDLGDSTCFFEYRGD